MYPCMHVSMYCLLHLVYVMCVIANFVFIVHVPIVCTSSHPALSAPSCCSISSRGLFSITSEDSIGAVNGLAVFSSELTLVLPNLVRIMMYIHTYICRYVHTVHMYRSSRNVVYCTYMHTYIHT